MRNIHKRTTRNLVGHRSARARALAPAAASVAIAILFAGFPGRTEPATASPGCLHSRDAASESGLLLCLRGGTHDLSSGHFFQGTVEQNARHPEFAVALKGLSTRNLRAYVSALDESLDRISEFPEGRRFLAGMNNVGPLPHRLEDGRVEKSQFVNAGDRTVSPVKIVFVSIKNGDSLTASLNNSAESNGLGSASVIKFDAEAHIAARDTMGRLTLFTPADVVLHELVHASHSLMGMNVRLHKEVTYIATIPDSDNPGTSLSEEHTIPVEEALTHGGPEALAAVNRKYPPSEAARSGERQANAFEAQSITVAGSEQFTAPPVSLSIRDQAANVRDGRRNFLGLSETSVFSMGTARGESVPIRAHYCDFEKDHTNPAMFTNGRRHVYRISGNAHDISLSYRVSPAEWEHPPPGSSRAPMKVVIQRSCESSPHFVACAPRVTHSEPTEHERESAWSETNETKSFRSRVASPLDDTTVSPLAGLNKKKSGVKEREREVRVEEVEVEIDIDSDDEVEPGTLSSTSATSTSSSVIASRTNTNNTYINNNDNNTNSDGSDDDDEDEEEEEEEEDDDDEEMSPEEYEVSE